MMKESGPKDLKTMYRVFSLIKLLSAPPYYKATGLAERLEVSKKTVYNYLELLEAIGYEPDTNKHHQHFLPMDRPRKATDGLEVDDAKYLQEMLWQMPDSDHRRNQLLLWLNRQYALGPAIENLTRYTPAEHRKRLTEALENGKRVRLMNYRDAAGKISPSRYLEPVAFQQDYTYIYVYDLDKDVYRQFHLGRIGFVEVLEEEITGSHLQAVPDFFGWTGPKWLNVRLELTPRAKQLLLEEYPQARPYVISLAGGQWLADLQVKGFPGVGRWCLGLCAEVRVLEGGDGAEFRGYLNGKWKGF
jgi:proteasome accessory factor C